MKKVLIGILSFWIGILPIEAQTLYGTTATGGIYKFVPATNDLTVLKTFESGYTWASLMQAVDLKLYSNTTNGGEFGNGNIYSFDPLSSTYVNLKSLDYTNEGGFPYGALIQADDKKLYGMTSSGGPREGVLFSFDPSNSKYTNLLDIGGQPMGSLIQASDKKLYGMTLRDGGTIFSYAIQSSTYTILMTLGGRAGAYPYGSLIQARNGKLYGMTSAYGALGYGVIFSYDPSCFIFKKLKDFNYTDGAYPYGSLVEASDGKLYGLTSEGGSDNKGVIFSYDPSTAIYTKLKDFTGNGNGANPRGSLMQASDGKLYGRTNGGGSGATGVIFSFDPSSSTYTKLKDYGDANATDFDNAFIELKECVTETTWYKDADGDGYGNPAFRLKACTQPAGYTTNNKDCDDNDNTLHNRVTYYRDLDRDGYGDSFNSLSFCSNVLAPPGYVTNNYDCYDSGTVSHTEYVRVRMCHDGWTQCVNASEISAKLGLGWTLGPCSLQTCAADETLLCHNGRQECVETKYVAQYLAEGNWSAGPYCSGTPISRRGFSIAGGLFQPVSETALPPRFKISNYPNPFAGTTIIRYELPTDSRVSIKVYDQLGRQLMTLVDEYKKAGNYTVPFRALRLSSGSLFYRLRADSKDHHIQQTGQMIKIK